MYTQKSFKALISARARFSMMVYLVATSLIVLLKNSIGFYVFRSFFCIRTIANVCLEENENIKKSIV